MGSAPAYLRWHEDGMLVKVLSVRELNRRNCVTLLPIWVPEYQEGDEDELDKKEVGVPFEWGPSALGLPWDNGYKVVEGIPEEVWVLQCPRCEEDLRMEGDYLCEACRYGG